MQNILLQSTWKLPLVYRHAPFLLGQSYHPSTHVIPSHTPSYWPPYPLSTTIISWITPTLGNIYPLSTMHTFCHTLIFYHHSTLCNQLAIISGPAKNLAPEYGFVTGICTKSANFNLILPQKYPKKGVQGTGTTQETELVGPAAIQSMWVMAN